MTLYAYYKPGEREETLERHVLAGLKYLEELYIRFNYHMHISRRLMIGPSEAEYYLKAAYALHDLGKAYSPFQDLLRSGRGAPGHEVLSAVVTLKGLNVDSYARKAIALSILLHHHAMRSVKKAILKVLKTRGYMLSKDSLELLLRFYSEIGVDVMLATTVTIEDLRSTVLKEIAPLLEVDMSHSDKWREHTLAYLILHPLITCDALAAATARYKCEDIKCLWDLVSFLPPWIRDYLLSHPIAGEWREADKATSRQY